MSRGLAHLIVSMSHSFVDSMSGLECIRVILYQSYIINLSAANSKDQYNLQFHAFSYSLTSWTIHVLPFRTHVIAQNYYTSTCLPSKKKRKIRVLPIFTV